MYCLDPLHPSFNAVLETVAANPGISLKDLHQKIETLAHIDLTLQHLYRIVNRMIDQQILLKEKGVLRINLMWLSHIELFAQSARSKQQADDSLINPFPLKPNTEIKLTVPSLRQLQNMWYHLLVNVRRHTDPDDKDVCKYYSHAWWSVSETEESQLFFKRIAEKGIVCYWLYGNDTFLDRAAVTKRLETAKAAIATNPPFPAEGYNLNVHGEYIVECVLPSVLSKHLQLLFQSIDTETGDIAALFNDIFDLKEKCTIKIRRDAKRANGLKAKIKSFFS